MTERPSGNPSDDRPTGVSPGGATAVGCAMCGATAQSPPLTWMREIGRGRDRWFCQDCSRQHLRAVEAKLDQEWW